MANFTHLLVGVTLVLSIVFLANVHSSPVDNTPLLVSLNTNEILAVKDLVVVDTNCNNHGTPHVNGTGCDCERGWTNRGNTAESNQFCNYQQRSKQTAFFLSLFLGPLGADWFYLSRSSLAYIVVGILKLLLGCGCCGSWPLTFFGPELQNAEATKGRLRGVSTFFTLVAFAWWIVDWARILSNRFPDGNHAALIPW